MEYEVKWYKFHRKTLTWTMAGHSKLHGKENRLLKRNIYLLDEWRKKSAQHTQGIIGSWHGTHERKLIYDFTSRRLCSSYINIPSATKRYFFCCWESLFSFACVRLSSSSLSVCEWVSVCSFCYSSFFSIIRSHLLLCFFVTVVCGKYLRAFIFLRRLLAACVNRTQTYAPLDIHSPFTHSKRCSLFSNERALCGCSAIWIPLWRVFLITCF